ncbi:MAG: 3-methyl-2-oxobutanoate hydroxymethyltransferase [Candidatus Nitrohelix vancouverensis]|uniref:3-methyl-2-oxobutanoate hydroxymethyltransferase n=1 Tax=Candidatus Nitrohelix vancouverensis TaxID=2705534 RepID=A0A7T0C3K7_9BACT|nr:MAG: 3-methyl-2-oxobutanoate hydroxymethyltransferase [Candidatus Nitrohelix vancouverensis]
MKNSRVTIPTILNRKSSGKKIVALTAYDYSFGRLLNETDLDLILVGDSLGMMCLGYENTLPVTMEDMILHTRSVKRAVNHPLLVSDLPFMSYQISVEEAIRNAGRLMQEGGADAVKLEGGAREADKVSAISQAGIPVMGHIGLTPQSVHQMGGYRIQGKHYADARQIKQDARELQKAGAFSIVLEGMPGSLAAEITKELKIPTVGIGAGVECDGQILVLQDLLGMNVDFTPKFVKQYANLGEQIQSAVQSYVSEVRSGEFPAKEHTYNQESPSLRSVEETG